jgi:hydroxymethylglutaryl-CoA reductase (NADPH)
VQRIGTTRGPVFKVKNTEDALKLKGFITRYFKTLAAIAAGTSTHLKLLSCSALPIGQYVFVRCYFDTGDAMGMNMVTIATQAMVDRIEKETGISCLTVAGNFDVDKKPAWLNAVGLRGWSVRSEVVVPEEVLKNTLKTSAEKIHEIWLAKCMVGSAASGSMGFNAQYANVVAALFLATGQDAAHVVEGSMGITTTEVRMKDLYVSIHIPALMVGTVGGGTNLATQQEALKIMGVAGTGKVAEFASVAGGAVLAGEISLLASLAEGSLVRSHEKLARGQSSNNQYSNSK